MNTLSYKTQYLNNNTAQKEWIVIDATNEVVGRLCSRIALILRGKHKPGYTPHSDTGDNVIVINASKVRFTGNKMDDKYYYKHSHYPGGLSKKTPREMLQKDPRRIIELGVKGMLPKTKLGNKLYTNLRVYSDANHPHEAQQPKEINLQTIR
ncbi:MAG: 50S ribosomal protein L13 [Bacteroidales bacterium]